MRSDAGDVQHVIRAAVSTALQSPWVIADPMRLVAILTAATADVLIGIAYDAGKENDPKFRDAYADKAADMLRAEIGRAWATHDNGGRR